METTDRDYLIYKKCYFEIICRFSNSFLYSNFGSSEHVYIYDLFLAFLIHETEILCENIGYKGSPFYGTDGYKRELFKRAFADNFNNWKDKILHPEKYPEFKRKVRQDKLKKIYESSL